MKTPEMITVEREERNPDGTTTLHGTTSSGEPIVVESITWLHE